MGCCQATKQVQETPMSPPITPPDTPSTLKHEKQISTPSELQITPQTNCTETPQTVERDDVERVLIMDIEDGGIPEDMELDRRYYNYGDSENQSNGTFVKYASETEITREYTQSAMTVMMRGYTFQDEEIGVYMIGRNAFNETGSKRIYKSDIKSLAPSPNTKNITNIICGNGYDIYCAHNDCIYYGIGRNNYGQCGVGNWDNFISQTIISYFIKYNIKISKICASVSGESTFWISNKNKVYGNGRNNKNQLGLPDNYSMNRNKPNLVKYLNNIIDIKCAYNYSLALGTVNIDHIIEYWYRLEVDEYRKIHIDAINIISKFHGFSVYSTEYSLYGGNGHNKNSKNNKKWKEIEALSNTDIICIETGYYHSLFLEANGVLWSCGDNDHGQCANAGNDNELSSNIPKPIKYFLSKNIKIHHIVSGHYHNLALDKDDRLWSWGGNRYGQCGNGGLNTIYEPQLIETLKNERINKIKCGSFHSYAQTIDGRHFLWGSNKHNECTNGSDLDKIKVPKEIERFMDDIYLGDRDTKWILINHSKIYENINNNIDNNIDNIDNIDNNGNDQSVTSIIIHHS